MKNRISLLIAMMLYASSLSAQQAEMADTMRSEGKIYVVVAIMLVIFTGLTLFLFRMDRKIRRMEEKTSK